jgi:hypothetical protein
LVDCLNYQGLCHARGDTPDRYQTVTHHHKQDEISSMSI